MRKTVEFSDEEKIRYFDEIAEHFYKGNFSKMSKSEIDLLMFHFYIEKIMAQSTENGQINYNKCSDYRISKDLGITQQRIRNLKVKNQLTYPNETDWKSDFAALIEKARYDSNTKKITVNIPDPNLYIEIQNFIEEMGGYVDIQLNSKFLCLRIEYFIELAVAADDDDESRKKIVKELKKSFKAANADEAKFDEKHIGKSLLDMGANASEIIVNLPTVALMGNAILSELCKLISNLT
ncbi:MAG: hypothetical protein LUI12_01040 [Clostridiales bacterium]|nr:hypothetical protein [Clostridiales bacterium]